MNRRELITRIATGERIEFEFFWNGPFSQWASSTFRHEGITYPTAEHYMMAEKARLFQDRDAEKRILATSHPKIAKEIGRSIQNYNDQRWSNVRFEKVVQGNLLKFGQNVDLKEILWATGNKVLVEASPVDKIWGIGLTEESPNASNPAKWQGQNLLGFALMEVRAMLSQPKEQ